MTHPPPSRSVPRISSVHALSCRVGRKTSADRIDLAGMKTPLGREAAISEPADRGIQSAGVANLNHQTAERRELIARPGREGDLKTSRIKRRLLSTAMPESKLHIGRGAGMRSDRSE